MWAMRHPANILLEVGPHVVAHVLDLMGSPDRLGTEALDPVMLPGGMKFYRRWLVRSFHGKTVVDTRLSFGPGFPEHRIEVRGSAGTATVDYERGTYVLRRRTHLPDDFDRYARTAAEARELVRHARRNLARYALSKAKLVRDGNAFGASIAGAVRAFYTDLPAVKDTRLTAEFGGRVVRTCLDIAKAAGFDPHEDRLAPAALSAPAVASDPPDVFVLGGTGFIGRAVVRRLIADGRRVRVLARDPASLPDDLRADGVDVCRGDLGRPGDLARALEDVPAVIHLARSHSKTWDEYLRDDIGVTRAVAEACLAAGVKRLVYTGTTDSYYSGDAGTITEDTPLDPRIDRRNLYARAKAEAERLLLGLHREKGLPVVIARPAVVIGPGGDPHHWGVGMWATPETCRFWGDGDHPVPLVLVDDVADALVRCLDADGAVGQVFNLASDPLVTPREYVAALAAARGTWIDARPTPAWRFFAGDLGKWVVKCLVRHPDRRLPSYRDWKSRTYRARYDCSKAKRVLGWTPVADKETLLEQGVRRPAAEWSA
jgi:nucleoside-diphosphate-sugar epimerase